jgi:hypothetical protein
VTSRQRVSREVEGATRRDGLARERSLRFFTKAQAAHHQAPSPKASSSLRITFTSCKQYIYDEIFIAIMPQARAEVAEVMC